MSSLGIALPLDFDQPAWLWLCLLVPVLIVASLRSLAGIEPIRRVLALIVRSALVILIACCLAGVQRVRRNDDLTVMFLMDRSYSVQALQEQQEAFILEATEDVPADDRVGMIDFARNAFLEQLPVRGGYILQPGRLPMMPNTDRTDIASAMRLAMAMFPHDTAKRIVLMSDGNDNMGDVITEARRAKASGIPVDVVPLWYERQNEVYFERMIAPTHAEPGEQVPIRMVLGTQKSVSGTISIYHNSQLVDLPQDAARVHLKPGSNTFFMKIPVNEAGTHAYEAVFRPDNDSMDGIHLNNSARAFSFVSGASRALLITMNALHDQPLVEALRSEKVKVDMKTWSELGEFGLLQMMSYSTIILANVPAATFTDEQQKDLAAYVKDMGSGLIMTGGDEGFGAGGWIGSPVEEVMPVTFELTHKRVIPQGALVLIMHSCEMPKANFWGTAMAKKSVDTISSRDYFGVLTYTWSPGGENWEVPLDLATNKAAIKAKINRMQVGDMPDFATTMQMAFKELTTGKAKDAAQKHVIIFSDGDATPPSAKLLADYKREKITVSTIGIGWGSHVFTPTMKRIATATDGKFHAPQNARQLPQIFMKESKVVRRPLIVDEEVSPQILHAYSDLLAGIDPSSEALPKLGGMVLTSAKPSPNVLLPLIRVKNDEEDPVLAHWQCELGKTVAFTSGYWPIWGEAWMKWPKFAKLWAQIVRWTMRQESPANFETYTRIEGNRGRIVIDALDKDASYLNFLQFQAKVIGPGNTAIPLEFTQTGPGHYEAEFEAEQAGQYIGSAQVFEHGKPRGMIRTGISLPFSPEYRDLAPNETLLRQVADITGGRWLVDGPKQANVFSHDLPPTEAKRPAWDWILAWLLLPAFLLDVSVRRLASWLALSIAVEIVVVVVLLFGADLRYSLGGIVGTVILAELIGWTIRFRYIGPLFDFMTHGVTALSRTGERSEVALEQLKTTRERVRDDLAADKGEPLKRISQEIGSIPTGTVGRRFDVGDEQAHRAAGDLHEALGGAKVAGEPAQKRRPPAGADQDQAGDEESPIERLRRAKDRAKRDMRKDE